MPRILRTLESRQDYAEIWSYVAAESLSAADRLIERFDATLSLLATAPGAGVLRTEFGAGMRSFPVGQYLIFYRTRDDRIELICILHGARDLPRIFQ